MGGDNSPCMVCASFTTEQSYIGLRKLTHDHVHAHLTALKVLTSEPGHTHLTLAHEEEGGIGYPLPEELNSQGSSSDLQTVW